MEVPAAGEPPGLNRYLGEGLGKQRGLTTWDMTEDAGVRCGAQSKRRRLTGVGVGNVQVDGVIGHERRWV